VNQWRDPHFFETSDPPRSSSSETSQTVPSSSPMQENLPDLFSAVAEAAFPESDGMTLVDHIAELRARVLISATTLALGVGAGFYAAPMVMNQLKALAPKNTLFIQVTMGEALMTTLSLALYIGIALAAPVILHHVLRFIKPGLHAREQTILTWTTIGGTLLFILGVIFAYYFVLGPAIDCLLAFGSGVAIPSLSIREFISFCAALLFVTGLMFELPMVLFLLSFTGLVSSAKLIKEWRTATIAIFLIAAVVTPTQDPLSMSIVGAAMVGLYALSIIPIRLCGR
jgi:sec-independent protein translocase protein TatC